ncbi:aldehyde dehydrogenase family protein [Aeromicrobium sp. Leaf350]|uniref:aldehyde dehydrogenase family protein n=1 Tax=Aeromicrobium sp. Leaf350 TaxID=2876565 RepID=UPI001E3CE332|nr:aldehyde dehydrogenase family protein [Aeromicrobium sp. Leaf350]
MRTTASRAIPAVVDDARQLFESGVTRSVDSRLGSLRALRTMLLENQRDVELALWSDLRKGPGEAQTAEINVVIAEINHTLRHLRRWMRPQRGPLPLSLRPARASLKAEPLGVVLVIAPWNYPVQLLLAPLVGILAAGNTAVLKPSELTPATSRLMALLVSKYFPDGVVRAVEGGVPETTELLKQRFDHIVFTGSGPVGRIVMRAAAEHLTPVTLELGGKSPAWFDDDDNLHRAARRLAWAKFSNAGQTCVAPDYVMTTPDRVPALVAALRDAIADLWGADPRQSDDYGRIVDQRNFDRLAALIDRDEAVIGGDVDRPSRYIAPRVVVLPESPHPAVGPRADHPMMREEIFGPILPILPVADPREAVAVVNGWDKPLALYVFSSSGRTRRLFEEETSSGALVHNAAIIQVAATGLPFGGVGASGIGSYHGAYSWQAFSHIKPVLDKPLRPDTLRLAQPPYGRLGMALSRRLMRHG